LSFTSCPAGTITPRTSRLTTKGSFSCLRTGLLGGHRSPPLRSERGVEGVPAEARALDASRGLAHARERPERAERRRGRAILLREEGVHLVEESPGARAVLALDRFGHEGGRGRRDGAAAAFETDVLDAVAVQPHGERQLIAAQGVVSLRVVVRPLERAEIA